MRHTIFGTQEVRTRVYHVLPDDTPALDVLALLREAAVATGGPDQPRAEAWIL